MPHHKSIKLGNIGKQIILPGNVNKSFFMIVGKEGEESEKMNQMQSSLRLILLHLVNSKVSLLLIVKILENEKNFGITILILRTIFKRRNFFFKYDPLTELSRCFKKKKVSLVPLHSFKKFLKFHLIQTCSMTHSSDNNSTFSKTWCLLSSDNKYSKPMKKNEHKNLMLINMFKAFFYM